MRLCRFEKDGVTRYGSLPVGDHEGFVQPLAGTPFTELVPDGKLVERAVVRMLAPMLPSKIVAVGRNYRAHAAEMGKPVPEEPLLFLKATTALLPPEFTIRMPKESQRVDYEGELAVIIGKQARRVSKEDALSHVLGYACFNDVTARDIQQREVQFTRAKSFDTFAPLGPFIETDFDGRDQPVRCRVNGEVRQDGRTSDMVFDIPTLISYISACMTLLPGDVIATGTPAGVGPLTAGDVVEVEIAGLGVLRNPVARDGDPA